MPLLSEVARPVVGNFYMVPSIHVDSFARVSWIDRDGWVPVHGPKHRDAEFLDFDVMHAHVDWRFASTRSWRAVMRNHDNPLGVVLSNDGASCGHSLTRQPELRRLRCNREMPTFPDANRITTKDGIDYGVRWARMERAQAITCNKLKPGNICPHRGFNLTQFAQPDGTAVCPGHGLRWDLATGELMPRFAGGHMQRGAA